MLLPRELDIHSSACKERSPKCALAAFSEVPHSLGPGVVGCSVAIKIGGDHGLLERRTTAPAHKRAGAQEDRLGLAHSESRRYREGYELGNALLLVHEGGRRQARAPKAARANL